MVGAVVGIAIKNNHRHELRPVLLSGYACLGARIHAGLGNAGLVCCQGVEVQSETVTKPALRLNFDLALSILNP
jgi:hypothetical protein